MRAACAGTSSAWAPGRVKASEDALASARQLRVEGFAALLLDTSPQPQDTARALAAARRLRVDGFAALLLDTSPQPQETARALADAMGARYLPLPHAGAATLSNAVRAAGAAGPAGSAGA